VAVIQEAPRQPAEREIEVYTQSQEIGMDNQGNAMGSAVFRDRHGNTYHVDHPGLAANLQRFIGQPDTPQMRLAVERVVQQHVWDQWQVMGSGTAPTPALYGSTTSDVWLTWNSGTATTSGTTVTLTVNDADNVWTNWQDTGTANEPFFNEWATNPNHTPNFQRQYMGQYQPPAPETAEEREARVQRELQQRERWERERAERERRRIEREAGLEAARVEAKALLDSLLTETQKNSLENEDWFLVIGKSGNIYRLRRGRVGNIDLISPEGRVLRSLCSHPGPRLPNADDLVAQKLYLETDDEYVQKQANVHYDYGTRGQLIELAKHLPRAA
jgi:hypothetical protein